MTAPILIIGGGLAGLFTALKLSPRPCTVISPRPLGEGASSAWAQGGIAAALAQGDSPGQHAADTVAAGAGLVDEPAALALAQEAAARVHDLLGYGVPFDRDLEGHLAASREAAHSRPRVIHVRGDQAGRAVMETLIAAVRATPSITVKEGLTAEGLVLSEGRVTGVHLRDENDQPLTMPASAVVLATGGIGHLYRVTTNPLEANGTGLAIAAMAGAVIADPEFVQFHPTALDAGRDPAPLITEALRGEGAVLVNGQGVRFMVEGHPLAELAPRDIVARAVFAEIEAGRGAFLDARQAVGEAMPERFPGVTQACRAAGIDPVRQPIPIAPAAHYHMGGVWTDSDGRTSVPGLWAVGEVACTGVHGANRLASNSLLEALVYAARAAEALRKTGLPPPAGSCALAVGNGRMTASDEARFQTLRQIMQTHVGVVRTKTGLSDALGILRTMRAEAQSASLRNALLACLFIARAALMRHESRGAHWRDDAPHPDPAQAHHTRLVLHDVLT